MSFITINRHWDVLVYEATHRLKQDVEAPSELGKKRLLVKGTLIHLKLSRKIDNGWECLVLTPKIGKRGYQLKSGADIWFVNAEALERIDECRK